MEENTEEKVEQTAEELIEGKEPIEIAEYYISWKRLEEAQKILNSVDGKSGKKFYLQSLIYKERKWYGEQRKHLKKAVKAEPDNEDYKKELKELEEFKNTPEYRSALKEQRTNEMGGVCAECGAECCCGCVCQGICEGLANGC